MMLPAMSQSDDAANGADASANASNSAETVNAGDFYGDDAITLKYVPNRFIDNWEISLNGGVSLLINGLGHTEGTQTPGIDANGAKHFYETIGGVGELSATKWFNPYVAARLGWTTGYLPFDHAINNKETHPLGVWHNYLHVDMMWDWTTQFGGYKPNRVYDAVPYVHVGVVANPICNAAVGGGLGFLNRFHVAHNWVINIDLRGMMTTARKFGKDKGVAIDVNALVGVSYRFNQVGWKTKIENPYKETLDALQAAGDAKEDKCAEMAEDNKKLEELAAQREQERTELAKLVAAITKDTTFYGVPDTMEMTVYYAINSSELTSHERAHMDTYLRLINLNDPNYMHKYKVIGTADSSTGSKDVNERVCQQRADAIKKVLVENGVDPENIETEIEIIESGDVQLARASHVIIYPVEKPKYKIPATINLDE